MHELSLCENIVVSIEEAALTEGFNIVTAVYIGIGQLSCVEPAALRFCFDPATSGSIARNAQLFITVYPGLAKCKQCGASLEIENYYDACSCCESFDLDITGGEEMQIESLEVA
ncbi:MAG: hydrogenase maturation nickel metallochaperone HypA [Pseudomonadales bacterium]|nr:hydrogenase maturation nickel metallochaperone HypA [Pseudomonadales bacterium]PCI06767.1 MAG: hydrogenase maturation nickel metallochaperone HypA [Gammaproteobacteria bacterium]